MRSKCELNMDCQLNYYSLTVLKEGYSFVDDQGFYKNQFLYGVFKYFSSVLVLSLIFVWLLFCMF